MFSKKINFRSYAEEANNDGDAVAYIGFFRCLRKEMSAQSVSFSGYFPNYKFYTLHF